MSGAKRRTPYRKRVTDAVLNDFPEPGEGQRVAVVRKPHGSNLFEILLEEDAPDTPDVRLAMLPTKFRKLVWIKRGDYLIVNEAAEGGNEGSGGGGGTADAGGASAAGCSSSSGGGGVRYEIDAVLYPEQIKHLKKEGKWPAAFASAGEGIVAAAVRGKLVRPAYGLGAAEEDERSGEGSVLPGRLGRAGVIARAAGAASAAGEGEEDDEDGEGEEEEESSDDGGAGLWVNRNHAARARRLGNMPSSDEEEEEEEEEA